MINTFRTDIQRYVNDIHTEVEFLYEAGRLSRKTFTLQFLSMKMILATKKQHQQIKSQLQVFLKKFLL